MKNILERDTTGKCVGECRNRVLEADRRRQAEINLVLAKAKSRRKYAPMSHTEGKR